jgi:hypothetical protein
MKYNERLVASWIAVSIVAQTTGATVALIVAATPWAGILPIILLQACLLGVALRCMLRHVAAGRLAVSLAGTTAGDRLK